MFSPKNAYVVEQAQVIKNIEGSNESIVRPMPADSDEASDESAKEQSPGGQYEVYG